MSDFGNNVFKYSAGGNQARAKIRSHILVTWSWLQRFVCMTWNAQ